MKICNTCNNAIENDGAAQCPYCGADLGSAVITAPVVTPAPAAAKRKNTGKKTGLIVLVAVLVIGILAGGGVLLLRGISGDRQVETEEREERSRRRSEEDKEEQEAQTGEKGKEGSQTGNEKETAAVPEGVETVSVQGVLWNSADNSISVADAQVVLQSAEDPSLVFETYTDSNGKFSMTVPVGDCILRFSCDGYESLEEEYAFDDGHTTYFGELTPAGGALAMADPEPEETVNPEYILDGSDQRYVAEAELDALYAERGEFGIKLARNEIYARYGRGFTSPEIQQYFDGCSWYVKQYDVTTSNSASIDSRLQAGFNDYEKKNLELIQAYEQKYHLNGK